MSPIRTIAAGMAVAAVAVFAIAAPASAHDELVFSDPAGDAQLVGQPESITMQFSGQLLTLGDTATGAVVLVVDGSGHDWAVDAPTILRDTVTVAVEPGMPDAGYQVRWQVVSEDGHPIAGVIPFTIGDAAPMTTDAGPERTVSTDAPDAADQTDTETSGALRALLVGAGGAVLAAALFALYRFLRRPKTAPATPGNGESADDNL